MNSVDLTLREARDDIPGGEDSQVTIHTAAPSRQRIESSCVRFIFMPRLERLGV